MQANYSEKEIITLLQKVQIFNRSIGSHEMFAINSSFDYVVKLSNGTIYFKVSELKDDENGTISPETLNQISLRFSNGSTNQQQYHQSQQQAVNHQNVNSQSQSSVNVVVQKQRGFSFGRFLLGFIGIVALVIIVLVIAAVVVVGRMPFF
jgi:hypothetical protein